MPRIVDEDVEMHDEPSPASWVPHSSILKAGRQLSTWFFSNPACTFPAPPVIGAQNTERTDSPHSLPRDAPVDMDIDTAPPPKVHVNSLPVEMLREIFFHYTHTVNSPLPEADIRPGRHRKSLLKSGRVGVRWKASTNPMTLGHVCSYWRALVQSMPTLWTTISVTSPMPSDVSYFAKWLELSGDMPLRLVISDKTPGGHPDRGIRGVMRLAFAHSRRWKDVSLHLCDAIGMDFSSFIIPATRTDFHLLEHFELDIAHATPEQVAALCATVYSAAPKLETVRFGASMVDVDISSMPWGRLTNVELNVISGSQIPQVLAASGNLQKLAIQLISGPTDSLSDTYTLPLLESIALGKVDDASNILAAIRAPSLRELRLLRGFGLCPPRNAWLKASPALIQAGCKLESFYVANLDMEEGEDILIDMLHCPAMASLRALTIASRVTDKLLRSLVSTPTHPNTLPLLEALTLSTVTPPDGELSAMIRSRTGHNGALRFVHASLYKPHHALSSSTRFPGVQITLEHMH
ncbi:hypothetical protein CC1G_02110 [Coprinopsis cinerea okayama7|uniref:Uncharacterized protein n=1 Tax=Coprinopsis cinerea (strain Okayama-7 / 130 / ATCC MYA-4618 / FGSC 9003) TaxID=240176 RepID=A8NK81_COPC7|nr:hypothetical protein CC1G_02110 [Coprinopsis cinerea okayama7\|eukprot:XP_001834374.2 hypothetical protein CC1G_02110 [Coprinopsis cinerea okayama7\